MGTTHDSAAGTDPEPVEPVDLEPSTRRSNVSRAVVAVVVVAMVAGVVFLAVRAGGSRGADEVLTAAKSAFTDDVSYRFTFRTTEELSGGDPEGAGIDTVTRTLTEGEVANPENWKLSLDDGSGWTEERLRVGPTLYRRHLDALDATSRGLWVAGKASSLDVLGPDDLVYDLEWLNADDPLEDEAMSRADREWRASMRSSTRLAIVATGHALDSAVDPNGLTRLVQDAEDAEILERRSDGLTLGATVSAPPALEKALVDPLPDAEVEIDLDADDRPKAVRVRLAENGAILRVDLRFSDWGAPIEVGHPADEQIDATPNIDEDGIRAVAAEALLVPTDVPEGLTLQGAKVTSRADGCSVVTLDYWPADAGGLSQAELDELLSAGGPYLWVNTHLQDCAEDLGIEADTSFDDELGGRPARQDWGWEVLVGSSVVALDSNLDDADLDDVAASLTPVGADELIASVQPVGG